MRRVVFLFILLYWTLQGIAGNHLAGRDSSSPAKDSLVPFPTPEWRLGTAPKAGAIAALSVNSSGLTSAFYRPFVRGGTIDKSLKEKTLEGMESLNRFGGDRIFSIGGSYRPDTLFGKPNEGRIIFIRLMEGRHYHASFTRDLFRTVFIGNANAEERLELAPFRLNSMHYRRFKIGLLDQRGDFELGIALSGIQGRSDLRIATQKAWLESQEEPSELRFRMKGKVFRQGVKGDAPLWTFPGAGLGIDILSGYDFGKYGKLRLSITDMGLLHWGPDASIQRVDTTVSFQGITIGDPFSDQKVGNGTSVDSLDERYLPTPIRGPYRDLFPGEIRLAYAKRFPSGFWFRSSMLHRPFTPHVPYIELELMKVWSSFRAGISVGYGGFGELAFGLQAAYRFGKKWDLYLRTPHLEGAFLPNSMGGLAASVGLHYHC